MGLPVKSFEHKNISKTLSAAREKSSLQDTRVFRKTHKDISPNDAHPLSCNIQSDESDGPWSEFYIELTQLNEASTEKILKRRKMQTVSPSTKASHSFVSVTIQVH